MWNTDSLFLPNNFLHLGRVARVDPWSFTQWKCIRPESTAAPCFLDPFTPAFESHIPELSTTVAHVQWRNQLEPHSSFHAEWASDWAHRGPRNKRACVTNASQVSLFYCWQSLFRDLCRIKCKSSSAYICKNCYMSASAAFAVAERQKCAQYSLWTLHTSHNRTYHACDRRQAQTEFLINMMHVLSDPCTLCYQCSILDKGRKWESTGPFQKIQIARLEFVPAAGSDSKHTICQSHPCSKLLVS